jgi:hypothetical protein
MKSIYTVTHSIYNDPDATLTMVAYSAHEAGTIAQREFGVSKERLGIWIESQDENGFPPWEVFVVGDDSVIIKRHQINPEKLEDFRL